MVGTDPRVVAVVGGTPSVRVAVPRERGASVRVGASAPVQAALGANAGVVASVGGTSAGVDLNAVHWRGPWQANTLYAVNDLITFDDRLWVCTHGSRALGFPFTDFTEIGVIHAPDGTLSAADPAEPEDLVTLAYFQAHPGGPPGPVGPPGPPIPGLPAAPQVSLEQVGFVYYDTTDRMLMCWVGDQWEGVALLEPPPPYTGTHADEAYLVWRNLGETGSANVFEFEPSSTIMRSFTSGSTEPGVGALSVEYPGTSLDALIDAGSYLCPEGIWVSQAPPEADFTAAYVLAVTSSPSTEYRSGEYGQARPSQLPSPSYQAGIQILTQLDDPTRVWRRGFSGELPSFGPWILSGSHPQFMSYTHRQATPATTWTVIHNLGFRPNVAIVDSAGTEVIGDVDYLDDNTVQLHFSVPFAGEAYLS